MPFQLTPSVIKHSYELLNATEPFSKWNLPDADDIKWKVGSTGRFYGWHDKKRNCPHLVAISKRCVGNINTLLETVAHEMIHLHIAHAKIKDTSDHGIAFKKFAAQVCAIHHHFDHKRF